MGKYAELDFCLNCEVFEDLANLIRIFIYILLVIQYQRPQPLQNEDLGHASSRKPYLELPQKLRVDIDRIEW